MILNFKWQPLLSVETYTYVAGLMLILFLKYQIYM